MFAFAFKNGKRAAELESGAGKFFSEEVCRVTGGEYSHVECWLRGPRNEAICSASREPDGISVQTLDLTDKSLWSIIAIPTDSDMDLDILWFTRGSNGKRYNMLDIAGIGLGNGLSDPSRRICSEYAAEIGDAVIKLPCLKGLPHNMIAPSGPEHDFASGLKRYGLRDLLLLAGYAQI